MNTDHVHRPPTERFSDRADTYARYRPGYPPAAIDILRSACALDPTWTVADIGSGTGLWTRNLLTFGCRVFGVEPNAAMRAQGEAHLAGLPAFVSVAAGAEATGLADASVDLVTAAQAFHWFDAGRCRAEFLRILKPGRAWVALVDNKRPSGRSAFMDGYNTIMNDLVNGPSVTVDRDDDRTLARVRAFFAPATMAEHRLPWSERLTLDQCLGRMKSNSHFPLHDPERSRLILAALGNLFARHQVAGAIPYCLETRVFLGDLRSTGLAPAS